MTGQGGLMKTKTLPDLIEWHLRRARFLADRAKERPNRQLMQKCQDQNESLWHRQTAEALTEYQALKEASKQ